MFLPIELIWFAAGCTSSGVILRWTTTAEINNDFFTIEKSIDGVHFQTIGTLAGAGSSNQVLQYEFSDASASDGISYYRLKQTDFDGQLQYSNIISVNCTDEMSIDISVYPNPATSEFAIEISGCSESVTFEIINSVGALVHKESFEKKTIVQTAHLAPGMYTIRFENGNSYEFKKIIKE